MRAPFVFAGLSLSAIGFGINICNVSVGVKYFGTFLVAIGGHASYATIITWYVYARTRSQRPKTPVSSYTHRVPNNTSGHYKRAVSVALSVTLGDCGGIIAGNVYRLRDQPRYLLGREYISYDLVYYPDYIADCR